MKIAIMGTGGVGGYYGALLAKAGHDVAFIARGKHLEAIREKGLEIKSVFESFTVKPATVTDNPATIGPVELVLFTTKTYHTEEASRAIKPIIGPNTTVVPFQNGVDAVDRIGAIIGAEHVMGGVTYLSAAIEAPGLIGQYSQFRRIVIGEINGEISSRAQTIAEALKTTGATVEISSNILQVLWTKYVFISAISAMGGVTRATMGEYRCVPQTRAVLIEALHEVAAVARAKGVELEPDILEKTMEFIDAASPGMTPSMQKDIEAGRVSELESMIGTVVRFGAELGVPTPFMGFAYAVLKPGQVRAESL